MRHYNDCASIDLTCYSSRRKVFFAIPAAWRAADVRRHGGIGQLPEVRIVNAAKYCTKRVGYLYR